MDTVIVTVHFPYQGKISGYDMEIPCHVPAKLLCEQIVQTLNGYSSRYNLQVSGGQIFCPRLGRTLSPAETPHGAGIWNGDYLELKF